MFPKFDVPEGKYAWLIELKYVHVDATERAIEAAFAEAETQIQRYASDQVLLPILTPTHADAHPGRPCAELHLVDLFTCKGAIHRALFEAPSVGAMDRAPTFASSIIQRPAIEALFHVELLTHIASCTPHQHPQQNLQRIE